MPRVTMTFNLPDEREEMNHALKGEDYYCVLFDYMNRLRSELKYNNSKSADKWMMELVAILEAYEITI